MPIRVECPECERRFKVRDELGGRRVKCPDCGEAVAVPENGEASALESPRRAARTRPVGVEEAQDSPRAHKRPREEREDCERPSKKSKKGLVIGLCAGGAVVAVGAIVLILVLARGGVNPEWLVGDWQAVEGPDKGDLLRFDGAGKLTYLSGLGKTVSYRLSGNELEMDVPAHEQKYVEELRKKSGKPGPVDIIRVRISLSKDQLVMDSPDFEREQERTVYKRVVAAGGGDSDPRMENDLKQIGLAYHNYCGSFSGKGPTKAEDLLPFMENDQRIYDRLKKDVILVYGVVIKEAAKVSDIGNTVLGYERDVPTRGGYVLFLDASVRRMSPAEFSTKPKAEPTKAKEGPPAKPKEFVSEPGGFSVVFPANTRGVTPRVNDKEPSPDGPVKVVTVVSSLPGDVSLQVSVRPQFKNQKAFPVDQQIKAWLDDFAEIVGKERSRKSIQVGKFQGAEQVTLDRDKNLTRQRILLVQGQLYHISAMGPERSPYMADGAEAQQFIESLQIRKK